MTTTETKTTTTASYEIPACNLDELTARVTDLNKRARRLKVAEIMLDVQGVARVEREFKNDTRRTKDWFVNAPTNHTWEPTGRVREWLTVTVTGEAPKYAGWALVAVLSPLTLDDGGVENIVSCVPGNECPAEYRDRVGECDHCKTNRQRNETFVVVHDNGEHRMVGRQCLRDFLGHKDPHALAAAAELLAELGNLCRSAEGDEWLGGYGREPESWTLEHFLKWTSSSVRVDGWTSGREAYESYGDKTSTKERVLRLLNPPSARLVGTEAYKAWKESHDARTPGEEDIERAAKAAEWAKDLNDGTELADYLYNVNLIARAGYVTLKTAGVAASIIAAYARHEAKEIERARKATAKNEHIGKVKQRLELTVTCERRFEREGMYGTTGIHKLVDPEGRSLVWFASGSATWMVQGRTYNVKATVKDHGEYNGRLETVVTRVTILDGEGE